jgi:hypothetical protein
MEQIKRVPFSCLASQLFPHPVIRAHNRLKFLCLDAGKHKVASRTASKLENRRRGCHLRSGKSTRDGR